MLYPQARVVYSMLVYMIGLLVSVGHLLDDNNNKN